MVKIADQRGRVKVAMPLILFNLYAWVGAGIFLVVLGPLSYLYREGIVSASGAVGYGVWMMFGVGIVTVAVWIGVFTLAVIYRRALLKRFNLWLGSLALIGVVLGILNFFEARDGILGIFTAGGEVALGGNVGSTVVGDLAWLGPLRILALSVVALSLIFPNLALDVVLILGKRMVMGYIFLVMVIKNMESSLVRMYRFDRTGEVPESSPATIGRNPQSDDWVMSADSSSSMPRYLSDVGKVSETNAGVGFSPAPPGTLVALSDTHNAASMLPAASPGVEMYASDVEPEDSGAESPLFGRQIASDEASEEVGASRYNKLWSAASQKEDSDDSVTIEQVPKNWGGVENATVASKPILDPLAASWDCPPLNLLVDAPQQGISQDQIAETSKTVSQTLAEYGVEVQMGEIRPGPTVTMYGLVPGWVRRYKQVKVTDEQGQPKTDESGKPIVTKVETKTRVKVDSILSREKDLALALGTPSIRIETPVMGKSLVGIEVPNPAPTLITLRSVMESAAYKRLRTTAKLPFALGKGSGGETKVIDLAKLPHLLVAGATGSGKSVFINTIVSSLLMERTPAEMRLLLVDPKRVELTPYNGIPHLLTPVVVETDEVVALLKGMIQEMLNRYRLFEEVGAKNIDIYNKKSSERMPYLVVAVDELADLMMSASFDVEQSLCRLAQLGRATGIHLIVATQRPSVDVVTGLIKANFPSRVSFAVTSQIDSRTIMDTMGAEKLLGRGDMLYQAVDATRPERVQGVFVSDKEIEDVVEFWRTTSWAPLPNVSLHSVGDGDSGESISAVGRDGAPRDEMLDKAIDLAHAHSKLSTSLLQRRMRIGYPRAARLMDELEAEGIVGPGDGSKSRDVIISTS